MHNNIIFVGGVHGVGKGTLCRQIANEQGFVHLSASDVLNWTDFSECHDNKLVKDVSVTQSKLIQNLTAIVKAETKYLLDGHFCLLKEDNTIERVAEDIFEQISPNSVILVREDPNIICERLGRRDGKLYDLKLMSEMQEQEVAYAREICLLLSIDLLEINSSEIECAISFCKEHSK